MLYCDSHIHILPQMDNGPLRVEESVAMLRALKEAHTRRLIATPHFDHQKETCSAFLCRRKASMELLLKNAKDALKQMRMILSAEVFVAPGVSQIAQLDKLTVPNTKCLPLELPIGGYSKETVRELSHLIHKRHFVPMICSLERYFLMYSPEDYQKLISLPHAVFQVGTMAMANRDIAFEAIRLVNTGHTVVLGSNAHGALRRPPLDAKTEENIKQLCGDTVFKVLSLQTETYFHDAFGMS